MAAPFIAGLPPFFTLTRGMSVRITALDPSDGSLVTGVVLSDMALSADQEDADAPAKLVDLDPAFLPGSEVFV